METGSGTVKAVEMPIATAWSQHLTKEGPVSGLNDTAKLRRYATLSPGPLLRMNNTTIVQFRQHPPKAREDSPWDLGETA